MTFLSFVIAYATASSSIGQTIFTSLWSVIISLFTSIASGLGSLFQMMMSGFGQSVVLMFQTFGFSMSGYGVWAPLMFVVGLGVAILVGYLFFDIIDGEKDITQAEDDL